MDKKKERYIAGNQFNVITILKKNVTSDSTSSTSNTFLAI